MRKRSSPAVKFIAAAAICGCGNSSLYPERASVYTCAPARQLAAVTKPDVDTGDNESYEYDAAGNTTKQTIGATTSTVTCGRSRPIKTVTGTTALNQGYDPFGRATTSDVGSEVVEQNAYDGYDRLTRQQKFDTTGTPTFTRNQTYDPFASREGPPAFGYLADDSIPAGSTRTPLELGTQSFPEDTLPLTDPVLWGYSWMTVVSSAEADIVNWASANGYKVLTVGAGRPICPACASLVFRFRQHCSDALELGFLHASTRHN